MTIIRRKHNSNFSVTPNAIFDSGMPIDTIGLLVYLITLPDDWKVNEKHVTDKFGFGRDRYRRMITEMIDAGYLIRETIVGADGKFAGQEIIVYDEPNDITEDGFSGDGLRGGSGKPDSILRTNNLTKNSKVSKKGMRLPEDWEPSRSDLDYAAMKGLTQQRALLEAEKFKNHFLSKAGKEAVKLDWRRTWQNWVLNCDNYTKSRGSAVQRKSRSQEMLEALARAAGRE